MDLNNIGMRAKAAYPLLARLKADDKNRALLAAANALIAGMDDITAANEKDLENARAKGMPLPLQDRLLLNQARIEGMADGLRQVATLNDPVGQVISMTKRPNGLMVGKKRVPLGVIGIIYEARPNVTADAFALTFKSGNSVILKGGSDAINSNIAIVDILRKAVADTLGSEIADSVQLIADTSRETTKEFMRLDSFVDVLIPRGGADLINTVAANSTIPVIKTGTGNCHVYVDASADLDMAINIIINAKTQRTGVCNACESILVHEDIMDKILPALSDELIRRNVEIRADEPSLAYIPGGIPATEEDWGTEYLDLIVSIKSVSGIDEAIAHINKYNTEHSECIVTNDYNNAQRFLDEIDAAAVYVNASTRFTDGGEFGFGAEIGISTQKLHARGPMGLEELTTTKYIIYGSGQVRP